MSINHTTNTNSAEVEDEEEDDYMNMVIAEPAKPSEKETYTSRRIRKEREAEVRGRTKSKAEREADEKLARDIALSRSMLADSKAQGNKGLKMMEKMGFRSGVALGKQGNKGGLEPVRLTMKEDRGGVGLDAERKRKLREETESHVKKVKVEESDYRDRLRRQRDEIRHESQFQSAMRIAERMSEGTQEADEAQLEQDPGHTRPISVQSLKSINVLWRGLVRAREEKERDRRMRHDLQQSQSRLPYYDDPSEDTDDKLALGSLLVPHTLVEDLEEEDPELETFNKLSSEERLQKLVMYLRETYSYCFWCKYTYPSAELEGCPGPTEEAHD